MHLSRHTSSELVIIDSEPRHTGSELIFIDSEPRDTGSEVGNTGSKPLHTGSEVVITGSNTRHTSLKVVNTGSKPRQTGSEVLNTSSELVITVIQSSQRGFKENTVQNENDISVLISDDLNKEREFRLSFRDENSLDSNTRLLKKIKRV